MVSFREASMRIYTQTTKVHSAGCTYLYYHVHIYVHLTIIIIKKKLPTWGWKEFAGGQVASAVGKKGRGESSVVLFQLNYIHKASKSTRSAWHGEGQILCDTLFHSSLWSHIAVEVYKSHRMRRRACNFWLTMFLSYVGTKKLYVFWVVILDLQPWGWSWNPCLSCSWGAMCGKSPQQLKIASIVPFTTFYVVVIHQTLGDTQEGILGGHSK